MSNTFFIADTHFHHKNILTFERGRKEFSSVEEMNERMVDNWNKVVKPQDLVYHLGDVTFKGPDILKRLSGTIHLVMGNHDKWQVGNLHNYFGRVWGVKSAKNCVLSHVPLHPMNFNRWPLNIHGHTHRGTVMRPIIGGVLEADTRYFCVSVEQINYTPISVEEIRQKTGVQIL